MNILELSVEHLEILNDLLFIIICKKIIKDYLFAENKNRNIRKGGEKKGFGPESENNSHLQGFQTKAQIKSNDA